MKTYCSYFTVGLTCMLLVSCGSKEASPAGTGSVVNTDAGDAGDATDAGNVVNTDAGDAGDAGQDASLLACTPGETRPCTSAWGCPSTSTCKFDGNWFCGCKACSFDLSAGSCSWVTEPGFQSFTIGNNADYNYNSVLRIDPEGSESRVQMTDDVTACTPEGGYYAIAENPENPFTLLGPWVPMPAEAYWTESLTFALCPASCTEHQQLPEVTFRLHRGNCTMIE